MLIGGYETTANVRTLSLTELVAHPAELAKLHADPGLIPGAVEEFIRYVRLGGGLPITRVVREDVRLGGVVIPCRRGDPPALRGGQPRPRDLRSPGPA